MFLSKDEKDRIIEVEKLLDQLKHFYNTILQSSSSFDSYEQLSQQIDECYESLSEYNIHPEQKNSLLEVQHLHHQVINVIQMEQSKLREQMNLLDKKQAAHNQYYRNQQVQESLFVDRKQ
ncbi:hypothetical protein [Paenibacillus arenosi]|uniref:Flagellar protein FliT n=1 Tax=Paenibacillus arenosi TaxID=2774142 RepID=A0ABR9AZ95_9BACL|nr:hypothetical protein [Paenibacillus arenosi]MBD8498261.1 hypothetical protein [Paenibacillus arenosi]